MLKNKLSHLALLDEQLERLQKSANEISVISGRDLESVEGAIVSLLTKRTLDGEKPGRYFREMPADEPPGTRRK